MLFLHHANKNGRIRGSRAFAATVDTSIWLTQPKTRSRFMLDTERRALKSMAAEVTESPSGSAPLRLDVGDRPGG